MSVQESRPRFVVVFDGRACFATDTREKADKLCRHGLEKRLSESIGQRCQAREPFLLHDPTEGHVEESNDLSYYCLTHHGELLVLQTDGWMACPVCSRV